MRQVVIRALGGVAAAVALLALCGSCDRGGDPDRSADRGTPERDHPAVRTAEAFLEAVRYRDLERAWKHHIQSTRGGVYCSSKAFERVLERTRKEKTERDCQEARAVGSKRRAALDRDAELLLQILRFTCEQPEGNCVDYAKKVFETQMPRSLLWKRLREYRITRVQTGTSSASVYVDIWKGDPKQNRAFHRTVEMRKYNGEWYVTSGPDGGGERHLPDEDTVR